MHRFGRRPDSADGGFNLAAQVPFPRFPRDLGGVVPRISPEATAALYLVNPISWEYVIWGVVRYAWHYPFRNRSAGINAGMTITNPLLYFLCMGWLLCVAHLLARRRPESNAKLNVPLESLRGLLATGVFFCHGVVTYFFFRTGVWKGPPSPFYEFLGSGTVDLFFFVSGYLFWSKCISDDGIRGVKRFFAARARRLVPGYYASVVLIAAIVAIRTGFALRVSPLQLALDLLNSLAFCFGNLIQPINGFKEAPLINAAVIWTLELEIIFYAVLPLLYRMFKSYRVFAWVGFLALTFWGAGHLEPARSVSWAEDPLPRLLARFFGFGFGFGMLVAFLVSKCPPAWLRALAGRRWSAIPILFLASPVLLGLPAHSVRQFIILVIPFAFVVAGNDFFGLLSIRSMLHLGKSSYSFYVTHGIVLYGLSHMMNRWMPIATLSPSAYWAFIACCGTVAVCLSYFLYRNVELRFMKMSSVLRQAGRSTRTERMRIPLSGRTDAKQFERIL